MQCINRKQNRQNTTKATPIFCTFFPYINPIFFTGATNAGDNYRCLIIVIIIFITTTTNMISQANCDWEGLMTKQDFLGVSVEILKASCDQMDDVKAAFRLDFQIIENTKLDRTKTKATSNQISFVRSALS